MNMLSINLSGNAPALFGIFFFAAFLGLMLVFLIGGLRAKFKIEVLSLIILSMTLFFFLGMKSGSIDTVHGMLSYLKSPPSNALVGKSGAMGMLFCIPALILSAWFLRKSIKIHDQLAFALPIAMIIQRIGCLFHGCCFGHVSQLPWAIQYGQGSLCWNQQYQNALISDLSTTTLPIHPIPLYLIFGGLVCILLILKLKNQIKAPGNLVLASLLILVTNRFVIEFFRHPETNGLFGTYWLGVKIIQWILLILLFAIGIIIVFRERKIKPIERYDNVSNLHLNKRALILYFFLFLIAWHYYASFTMVEKAVVVLFFIITGGFLMFQMLCFIFKHRLKFHYLVLVTVFFSLMSQSDIDSTGRRKLLYSYSTLDINGAMGDYFHDFYYAVRTGSSGGEGCSGSGASQYYWVHNENSYYGGLVKYSNHRVFERDKRTTWDFQMSYYKGNGSFLTEGEGESNTFDYNLNTMQGAIGVRHLWPYVGLGFGVSGGSIPLEREPNSKFRMLPFFNLSFGHQKILFAEGGFGDYTLTYHPTGFLGIGTRMGRNDDSGMRIGVHSGGGYYGAVRMPLYNNIGLNFQYHQYRWYDIYDIDYYKLGVTFRFPSKK